MVRGTAFDILAYELHETRLPELRSDELVSLEVSWVAGGLMVVAAGEDRATEGVLRGNVDVTFIGQDMVIKLPVRETRPEGSRNVFQRRLQVLQDEGVRCG